MILRFTNKPNGLKNCKAEYDKAKQGVEHAEREWEAYYLKLIELNES